MAQDPSDGEGRQLTPEAPEPAAPAPEDSQQSSPAACARPPSLTGRIVGPLAAYVASFGVTMVLCVQVLETPDARTILIASIAAGLGALIVMAPDKTRLPFRRSGATGTVAFLALIVTVPTALAVNKMLLAIETPSDIEKLLMQLQEPADRWLAVILVGVIAPLAEEAYFRGTLFPGIQSRLGLVPAVLLASLAFTGLHAGGKATLAILMTVACIWACLVEVSGNLLPSIASHAAMNGIGLLMVADRRSFAQILAWPAVSQVTGLALLVFLLAGVILTVRPRARDAQEAPALGKLLYFLGLVILILVLGFSVGAGLGPGSQERGGEGRTGNRQQGTGNRQWKMEASIHLNQEPMPASNPSKAKYELATC